MITARATRDDASVLHRLVMFDLLVVVRSKGRLESQPGVGNLFAGTMAGSNRKV